MNKVKRVDRTYNGIPTHLMNDIYDNLTSRDDSIVKQRWWAVLSLYLARSCQVIEKKYKRNRV